MISSQKLFLPATILANDRTAGSTEPRWHRIRSPRVETSRGYFEIRMPFCCRPSSVQASCDWSTDLQAAHSVCRHTSLQFGQTTSVDNTSDDHGSASNVHPRLSPQGTACGACCTRSGTPQRALRCSPSPASAQGEAVRL